MPSYSSFGPSKSQHAWQINQQLRHISLQSSCSYWKYQSIWYSCLWRNIPPSVLPADRSTCVLPRHFPKKIVGFGTNQHPQLSKACWPTRTSWGTILRSPEPASRAGHCRSAPRLEGTAGDWLFHPPGRDGSNTPTARQVVWNVSRTCFSPVGEAGVELT